MKAKRLLLLITIFSTVFAASVYADSLWGSYEGYPIVKVKANDSDVTIEGGSAPAFVINGSTVLPIRPIADAMGAAVKWDSATKTANLYKPNVHIITATKVSKDGKSIDGTFSKVTKGDTISFAANVQVDNFKGGFTNFRISVNDPFGEPVDSIDVPMGDAADNFWFTASFKVKFAYAGNYVVKFCLPGDDGNYTPIATKTIISE